MKKSIPTLFINVNESSLHCETCVLAKRHRATYSLSNSNKSVIHFKLTHSDVWGPSRKPTILSMRYFVLFIDNYTRLSWVDLLRNKNEVFPTFKKNCTFVLSQYDSTSVFQGETRCTALHHFDFKF